MAIRVKICGITSVEAADAAVRAGADYAGLMFNERSPRNLSTEAAAALAERMRGRIRLVAVLCDPDDETISRLARTVRPDLLQLHGSETPDRVGAIRSHFAIPVIKAIGIAEAQDFARVPAYEAAADELLFDAKPPPNATRAGGHGVAFDWQLLRGREFTRPWLLEGGLNSGNVQRAIRACDAPGVGTSSGVETSPGVKSPDLIREFVAAARSARYATEQRP